METASLDQNMPGSGFQLQESAIHYLRHAAKWARFIAIMGFIGVALMVVLGIVYILVMGSVYSSIGEQTGGPFASLGSDIASAMGFFYIILAVLYFLPILYLYRFSDRANHALQIRDENLIAESFRYLRAHYRFFGILIIIMLGFWVLAFAGGIIASLAAR